MKSTYSPKEREFLQDRTESYSEDEESSVPMRRRQAEAKTGNRPEPRAEFRSEIRSGSRTGSKPPPPTLQEIAKLAVERVAYDMGMSSNLINWDYVINHLTNAKPDPDHQRMAINDDQKAFEMDSCINTAAVDQVLKTATGQLADVMYSSLNLAISNISSVVFRPTAVNTETVPEELQEKPHEFE